MTANLTDIKKAASYKKISLYTLVILLLAGLVSLTPLSSRHDEDTQLSAAGDFWQDTKEDQEIAGVSAEAFYPVDPGPYLKNKAKKLESFIGINTADRQLYWFDNGQVSYTYPILRIADTEPVPTGQHEISYRNERHLSGDGSARLPYIQQFVGNHSIHGWPTGSDNQPVDEDFSGGSIWLSNNDALNLYQLAAGGTPVVVTDEETEETIAAPALPLVTAKSYVIADVSTGHIFARKDARRPFSIASISKLLTAIVAEDVMADSDNVYISQNAVSTYGRAGGLTAGQSLPLSTLRYPLLLDSSNDAATAIAEHTGFNSFMDRMNRKAVTIGMESTSFADPSGLSDDNVSTARDLFQLSRYLYSRRPEILEITTQTFQTTPDPYSDGLRNFTNNHPMAGRDDFLGGKNGYTGNARYTLLSIFRTESEGTERDVAIIILGSENYTDDTRRLLQWVQRVI